MTRPILEWNLFKMYSKCIKTKVMQNDKKATKIISNRTISSYSNRKTLLSFPTRVFPSTSQFKRSDKSGDAQFWICLDHTIFRKSIFSPD